MKGVAMRPEMEPMLTTRHRPRRKRGRKAWVTAIWPTTLSSNRLRTSANGRSSRGPASTVPVMFLRADGAHEGRVLNGGDDAPGGATAGAGEDVDGEHGALGQDRRRALQAAWCPSVAAS